MNEINEKIPTAEQFLYEIKRNKRKKAYIKVFVNTVSSLAVVAAIAVLISLLFLPILRVTGTSMNPTLESDQLIMCRKRSGFERGDIIAFYYNNKILLKRVIGTSGDVIDIKEDGTVYVNDKKLDEPYVEQLALGECDIELPYTVPEEKVFVLGDNREISIDSRSTVIGCVNEESIIGKAVWRVGPFKKIGKL